MVIVISDVVYCGRDASQACGVVPRNFHLSSGTRRPLNTSKFHSVLVLASASPRRQELLRNAGMLHTVCPANVLEIQRPGESPRNFVMRLAVEKAREVWPKINDPGLTTGSPRFVLGADTIVVIDDLVLGKPKDAEDALRMLRMLSGRTHEVLTAVCLLGSTPEYFEDVRAEVTRVSFDELREEEIRQYVEQGEPMDKAGAYAIQGAASRWVRKLEGDYPNVVGLPIRLVYGMLREHGMMF
jgi:septum formation protein